MATRKQTPRRGKYTKREHAEQKIIGPYAKANRAERGNGSQLLRICRIRQMIPMATWKKPGIARQDKWKQQQEDMAKENWEKKIKKNI